MKNKINSVSNFFAHQYFLYSDEIYLQHQHFQYDIRPTQLKLSKLMFRHFPNIRKHLWGGEFWSNGGSIGTVGDEITSEVVKQYVREQGSHDERESEQQIQLWHS